MSFTNILFQTVNCFFILFTEQKLLILMKSSFLLLSFTNCAFRVVSKSEVKVKSLNHIPLFVLPWTVAPQAPLVHGILQTRILKQVAIPFSRGSSQPTDQTQVFCIAGGFFTILATREAFWRILT